MAFKKVEKEILTENLIKQDLICQLKNDSHISVNIILGTISIFFIFLFSLLSPYAWTALVIPVSLFVFSYIVNRSKLRDAKNGEFVVITDKLLYEKQGELRTEPTFYKGKWISYLQFENSGRWELEGTYYTWSNIYKMSSAGICNTSFSGDTFYLIVYKKNHKVVLGYNTRFFDYQNH